MMRAQIQALDLDGDGIITLDEIQYLLSHVLGVSTDHTETALARYILESADRSGSGVLTIEDVHRFLRDEGRFSQVDDHQLHVS